MSSALQIEEYLTALDEETRLAGLREVSNLPAADALRAIFRALGDESWRIRKEAVNLYLELPSAAALAGEVVELLHSEDNAGLRNAAVEILVRLDRAALPFLHDEVDCCDHDVRKFVVDILGEIGDESSVPALEGLLCNDTDVNVRAAAAENLGKMRAAAAVPALLDVLVCPELLLQFAILEALARIGAPVPAERLVHLNENRLLRKPLYDCLGKIGEGDAAALLRQGLSDGMGNVREAAALALVRLEERGRVDLAVQLATCRDGECVDYLLEMLASPATAVRRAAVHLLGEIGARRAAVPLLELFDDEELLAPAARALVSLGRAAVCDLMDVWPAAPLKRRTYLAYVFSEAGCSEAIGLLVSALENDDPTLKITALRALGNLGGEGEIAELVRFLADDEVEVRDAAVDALVALGRRHDSRIYPILDGYLGDERAVVRCGALQVCGRLGGERVEPLLVMAMKDESPLVRRAAIRFLDGAVPAHLQSLTLALTDEESDVRRQAVEALADCGNPAVLSALALALGDEDIWVRTAAIRALGRFDDPQARAYIRRGLRDPVGMVTIAALETLAESDPAGCGDTLQEALNHPDEEVVISALRLLSLRDDSGWLSLRGESLLNHHNWDVRLSVARALAQHLGARCRPLLEARLLVEGEETVREELRELLEYLASLRE